MIQINNSVCKNNFFPSPPSQWPPPFYFVSMDLTMLDTSHNWNYTVFVFL